MTTVEAGDPFTACDGGRVTRGSQVEPSLAVNAHRPNLVLSAWQQDRLAAAGALAIMAAVSTDRGRTWMARPLPGITKCAGGAYTLVSDPEAGVGPDGRMYVSSIAVGPPGQAILVNTSADNGRTWSPPTPVIQIAGDSVILDKPALLVDQQRSSTAYVAWVAYDHPPGVAISNLRVDTAYVARTDDGGRHWSGPYLMYGANTENQSHVLTQLSDGSILDVFAEGYRLSPPPGPQQVRAIRSTDDGETWSAPVTIGRLVYSVATTPDGRHPVRASSQDISAAAGSNGQAFATWAETDGDHTGIAVAGSSDLGGHWHRLTDPLNARVVAFVPIIAVDARGDIGVSWYQTTAGAGSPTTVDLAVLAPGAPAWSRQSITSPFPLLHAPPSPQGLFLGDYEALVAQACGFRALDAVVVGPTALAQSAQIPANC
jgi:hypothetical protein